MSRSLLHAMELEFPWIEIAIADTPDAACRAFDLPLALVLVDVSLFEPLRDHAPEIARRHPGALLALFQPSDQRALALAELLACPEIRSFLPMNLKLDVWLAAVRLILLGGDYLPLNLLRSDALRVKASSLPAISPWAGGHEPASRSHMQTGLRDLTVREHEILALVARGLQNKVIASALVLSEHTVKIHLHNIIRKLCVHNRTEAARLYMERVAPFPPPAAQVAPPRLDARR
ncbi:helix-turn-helix transcriptional regulator [Aureimonas psammosilenae]|uniref:helix-turn-helix transcriptional regulator n=1 Tax=Aureimonas psammosilenae TaxID=2495496 RepID=UPI00186A221A|nr:response regulator transcription factor [Aureimonas psammosilenae]